MTHENMNELKNLTGLNWDNIKVELASTDWTISPHDTEQVQRSVYVGSVLNLAPSGKYYTPFAHGNVKPCPHCDGDGCDVCDNMGSLEAKHDQDWQEAIDIVSESYGLIVASGEGDPLDIFVSEIMELDTFNLPDFVEDAIRDEKLTIPYNYTPPVCLKC